MSDILSLEGFFIKKLSAEVIPPKEIPPDGIHNEVNQQIRITYHVARRTDDDTRYRMQLNVSLSPDDYGWEIDSEIEGYFKCPDSWDISLREGMIRVNGGTILYGLLRGQIAAFTGSFPPGPFLLPTISMNDVVRQAEEAKGVTIIENDDDSE
ncbi:MAG: hypothetical protein GQ565_12890 [Candidatus Aegiribacteria sp.]|nr:hypothetical protein [Candidatus Aegiribacteria sp.]